MRLINKITNILICITMAKKKKKKGTVEKIGDVTGKVASVMIDAIVLAGLTRILIGICSKE